MLLEKIDYLNYDVVAVNYPCIEILHYNSDFIVWIYNNGSIKTKEDRKEQDINISEIHYNFDHCKCDNIENNCNCGSNNFFYNIDDDLFLECDIEKYCRIDLSDCMRV